MALDPEAKVAFNARIGHGDRAWAATWPVKKPTFPFMLESVMTTRTKSLWAVTSPMISVPMMSRATFVIEEDPSEDARVDQPQGCYPYGRIPRGSLFQPKQANAPASHAYSHPVAD